MMKKNYLIAVIFTINCMSGVVAHAASSVREIGGTPTATNIAARTGSLRGTPGLKKSVINTTAKASTNPERTSVTPQRLSVGKYIGAPKQSVSTSTDTSNNALHEQLDVIENDIQSLQSQTANAITNVVESGQGTYVTDVSADGNQLNVSKTRLLYAPVRQGDDETITDTAEIWLVR